MLNFEDTSERTKRNPYNYSNFTYYDYPYNHRYKDNFYYGNRYYNHYHHYNYSIPYSYYSGYSTTTRKYMQSTITINVIDRAYNKFVWTGSAEGDIYDPAYLKGEIHPVIDKILKQIADRGQRSRTTAHVRILGFTSILLPR